MYQTTDQPIPTSFINYDAQQTILPQISHGERILWAGKPRQGIFLQPYDLFLIPFSLFWGGFAIFWTYTAWSHGAPWFFVLFGTPFVAIGLFLMVGRFFADARYRARTFYAVTNQRIIFLIGGKNQKITSLALPNLGEMTFTQNQAGRGTILFGIGAVPSPAAKVVTGFAAGASAMPSNSKTIPMFNQIERVKEVYEVIRKAQSEKMS
jgi:hypothetical protein